MNKNGLFLGLAVLSTTLFSCGNGNQTPEKFLVMPKGAPTLALYDTIINEDVTIFDTPKAVSDMLLSNDYKYIVSDAYNGQNLIDEGKCKNYTFKKLLTGGNFHLVGFDQTKELPTKDDYIIGFGNNAAVPNKVYNYLYKDAPVDQSFKGIDLLRQYLTAFDKDGKVAGQKIDWVFIAEPALFGLKSSNVNFKNKIAYDYNIKDVFKEKTGMQYLIQAGLFVNKNYLKTNEKEVNEFLTKVDAQLKSALNNIGEVVKTINTYEPDLDKQLSLFGFKTPVAKALQSENKNRFGIVDPDVKIGLEEIKQFKTIIG